MSLCLMSGDSTDNVPDVRRQVGRGTTMPPQPRVPGLVFPICTLVTFVSSLAAHSHTVTVCSSLSALEDASRLSRCVWIQTPDHSDNAMATDLDQVHQYNVLMRYKCGHRAASHLAQACASVDAMISSHDLFQQRNLSLSLVLSVNR